jgi:glutaredoxin
MTHITMYGTSACQACRYTEKRMEHYGLEATKVRLDEDPGAMERIATLGYGPGTGAPVVVVEEGGDVIDHWNGFRDSKLEALARKTA